MAKKRITESSGNVFADLGFADAEELDLKAELALRLGGVMHMLELTQIEAAERGASNQDRSPAWLRSREAKGVLGGHRRSSMTTLQRRVGLADNPISLGDLGRPRQFAPPDLECNGEHIVAAKRERSASRDTSISDLYARAPM